MSAEDVAERITAAFTRQADGFNRSLAATHADLLDAIAAVCAPEASDRWLEAACGPGVIARRLAPSVASVHGVDLTPAMVELAREEAARLGAGNATFAVGDATATGLPDGAAGGGFDGAVSRFSVHHIPRPGRLIAEMARVVRPGGAVVVIDHLADTDEHDYRFSQEVERLRDPSHWLSLTAAELRGLGADHGLDLEHEQVVRISIDFDDWLTRGTTDPQATALVEQALAERPTGTACFGVRQGPDGRTLDLQIWVGRFRRS